MTYERLLPFLLGAVLLVGACVPAFAQVALHVRVVNEAGAPIAGATVAAQFLVNNTYQEQTASTNAHGIATLTGIQNADGSMAGGRFIVHITGYALTSGIFKAGNTEVHLQKGTVWRGQVVDNDQKPLAGAKIGVTSLRFGDDPQGIVWIQDQATEELYSTQSGTDGSFEIKDVPATWALFYTASKEGFASRQGEANVSAPPSIIQLSRGNSLRGHLLNVAGKPLVGIHVFAQSTSNSEDYGGATSDKNGVFVFDALALGTYNVMASVPSSAGYVVPALENVTPQPNQTLDLPTQRAVVGVVIKGIVRDKATKLPIQNASIGASGPHWPGSVMIGDYSDAKGQWSLRLMPGHNRIYILGPPEGYLSSNEPKELDLRNTAPSPLIFELQKSLKVRGTTVDETGKPIKAQLRFGYNELIESDAKGNWSVELKETVPLWLRGGENETGYFEVVSQSRIILPTAGPIIVRLRRKPWQSLSGRVVFSAGEPVPNIEVKATYFYTPGAEGGMLQTLRSTKTDTQGYYTFKIRGGNKAGEMARELRVQTTLPGFSFQGGGDISANGTNWKATDLVLSPLNHTIHGQTEAGALVVADGHQTTADAAGKFVLNGLPAGNFSVYAAKDGRFGAATARTAP